MVAGKSNSSCGPPEPVATVRTTSNAHAGRKPYTRDSTLCTGSTSRGKYTRVEIACPSTIDPAAATSDDANSVHAIVPPNTNVRYEPSVSKCTTFGTTMASTPACNIGSASAHTTPNDARRYCTKKSLRASTRMTS